MHFHRNINSDTAKGKKFEIKNLQARNDLK